MLRYTISLFLLSMLSKAQVTAFEPNSGYNDLFQHIQHSKQVYKKVSSSPNTLTKISQSIAKSVQLRTLIENQRSFGTNHLFDDILINSTDVPMTTNMAEGQTTGSVMSPKAEVSGSTKVTPEPTTDIPPPSSPVSQMCLTHIETVIQGLIQKQTWALKMVDAAGKPPADIMGGNLIWLGDYEECLSVTVLTSLNKTSYSYTGQYCLVSVPVNAFKTAFTPAAAVSVGLCLPDSCTTEDTRNLINSALLQLSNNSLAASVITCQEPDRPLDTRAVVVLVIISLFIFIMVLGTAYDLLFIQWPKWRKLEKESELNGDLVVEANEKAPLVGSKMIQKPKAEIGIIGKVLVSFSVYTNGAKILNTDQGAGSLTALNGIRFLSMTWVILGHSLAFVMPISDNFIEFFPRLLKRISFMAISNALVSVDTFFTLSGILLTYLIMKEMKRKDGKLNWGMFYFHRFWRLTPPYMLVLLVHVALFRFSGSGPMWPKDGIEPEGCKTWYYNILYVNNFVDLQKMCFGWAWYLANDMQFFVLSPLILLPLFFFHAVGVGVIIAFLLGTWITTGVLATKWSVSMSQMDGGGDNYMSLYIRPYFRMGPYLVGMYTGYLLYRTKCRYRMNRFVNLFGWIVAAVVACLILYGQYDDINHERVSQDIASLYNTVHRTVWGACVSWVVFSCANGYGGFVNTILSWKGLIPLSRLTYCAYLVHPIVIYYYQYTRQRLFHFTDVEMIYLFLGHLVVSYAMAFVCSLAFESPMMGLEKVIFKREQKRS